MNKLTKKQLSPVKCFFISLISTVMLIVAASFLFTEFKPDQVANVIFWVGAVTMVVGLMSAGLLVPTYNKYQGQTVAIWTTLKNFSPVNEEPIEQKNKHKIEKLILGLSIAAPGMTLMIVSLWLFSKY